MAKMKLVFKNQEDTGDQNRDSGRIKKKTFRKMAF